MHASQSIAPETTSTRPSGRRVPVGYQRPTAMDAIDDQVRVDGSKMFVSGSPQKLPRWPPTTITRPSASRQCPAQKMLSGGSTVVKALVLGFQTRAAPSWAAPSHASTWPDGRRLTWTPTNGHADGELHCPMRDGAEAPALETVTPTGLEVVVLTESRATAVRTCGPSGIVVVFHVATKGGPVTSAPTLTPSTLNCTPSTPTLSAAAAVSVTAPLTVEPASGPVTETVGGVVSGGGGGRA